MTLVNQCLLLTGARGFIGSHLAARLVGLGRRVHLMKLG